MSDAPLKSVHITNYYHKNSGGISTSYNALMAAAGRQRRQMRLIVPGEKEEIEMVNDYARIYYIPSRKSMVFDKRYRIIMPWQYLNVDSIIRRILVEEKPDLVEITDKYTLSMFGAMVSRGKFKQLGRPMLVHFSCERMDDNISSFIAGGRISKLFSRSLMGLYNFPSFDFHIANSPYTAEEFLRSTKREWNRRRPNRLVNFCWRFFRSPAVPVEERIRICPRGVDEQQFSPERRSAAIRAEMVEKARVPADSALLLYAGRISPEKNVGLLADLMLCLAKDKKRDFRLLIAGAGPKEEWLRELSEKQMPGKICFLVHLDKETLADYYANSDIFIHPNPREPFGIAPLEAMASGIPTVVPNSGGLLFYATDENTWLCDTTPECFAAAIREVFDRPELAQSKVRAALETAAANTRERSTDFLLKTYDELWEDFQRRNELFAAPEAAGRFDFSSLVD